MHARTLKVTYAPYLLILDYKNNLCRKMVNIFIQLHLLDTHPIVIPLYSQNFLLNSIVVKTT